MRENMPKTVIQRVLQSFGGGGTVGSAEGKEVRQLDRSPEVRKAGGQSDVQHDTNPLPQSLPEGGKLKDPLHASPFTLHLKNEPRLLWLKFSSPSA